VIALVLSALLVLASAASAAPASVDLTEQFTGGLRDQGATGSCHAFASISLLEAAIKRRGQGEDWLSSADLFVRVALQNGAYEIVTLKDGSMIVTQKEGGKADADLEFALENGVARAETVPWGVFYAAYVQYRQERLAECQNLSAKSKNPGCRQDTFEEYVERLQKDAANREKKFLGDSKVLAEDRAKIKAKFKGLTLQSKRMGFLRSFDEASATDVADPGVCREKGSKQTAALVETLAANLPAVICFNMANLPGWGKDKTKKDGASHCVTAYGYSTSGQGAAARKSFRLRNSWGGFVLPAAAPINGVPQEPRVCPITFDIDEDHACAIQGMFWLTP